MALVGYWIYISCGGKRCKQCGVPSQTLLQIPFGQNPFAVSYLQCFPCVPTCGTIIQDCAHQSNSHSAVAIKENTHIYCQQIYCSRNKICANHKLLITPCWSLYVVIDLHNDWCNPGSAISLYNAFARFVTSDCCHRAE